ncbi:hypothetical protein [Actimicrobium sp. CCI2.3]|uniref:hypothetical protein n=1 Tax=Actimicrobium sp. CCI2.3 TaxID=3048616 RepID=UPI002AB4AA61|nr:hypothetical protein [Actimicrobium sp. CCI2.3]MDY7576186.1 hypothetical protein [Actimicrobium sp. CCI2.3]MEB0020609.1 hypothetical protein [Actimicrobium sp. CCI2.3]
MQKLIRSNIENAHSRHAGEQSASRTRAIDQPRTAPHPTAAQNNAAPATATAASRCRASVKAGHLQ